MRTNPVRFVCPACGLDASEFVDGLVRQELGQTATPPGRVVNVHPTSVTPAVAAQSGPQHGAPPKSALRVRIGTPAPVATWVGAGSETVAEPTDSGGVAAAESEALPRCPKHPSELAAEECYVCSKPICPKTCVNPSATRSASC